MGLDLGLSKVVIEGDNLSMIKSYMHEHVIRNENELAHILAKEGLRREKNTYPLERVPSYATAAIKMENRRIDQASLSV
ncbi:hypothetical protein Golob_002182 [Gossypium lobatum]|uniref:RNase H type-1 domain-containing protein n=1 Tax=Gossypium lobatum TaxID=34289 RepID=A0A7J8N475_9ROSI|nr:hypothetical protein [Gossypium lobatum]